MTIMIEIGSFWRDPKYPEDTLQVLAVPPNTRKVVYRWLERTDKGDVIVGVRSLDDWPFEPVPVGTKVA